MATKLLEVEFGQIEDLIPSWARSLRARNKSAKTIRGYKEAAELFLKFLVERGMPTTLDKIGREHVEAFIEDQLRRWRPTTALTRHQALRQFFAFAVEEGEVRESPMIRMKPPSIGEVLVPVVSDAHLAKLLKACEGKTYEDRRDTAILRLFLETGCRLSEVANLTTSDLDLEQDVILVVGKGSRLRACPFGPKCATALDRYLRVRSRHPQGPRSKALFIGPKGGLTDSGITQVLRRRCDQAAVPRIHPHQLRHTFAHEWLSQGGGETDLMRLAGWKSRQMVSRYAASRADDRAREAYRRILPGNRI